MKLQYHLRVNNHIFKQTTMAIVIVVIFGKTVNFQHFATLEPGVHFHFPRWQSESNNTSKYYAIPCNHELPSIPNPCNTIDNHWITLNTKGGGSTGLGLHYYSEKVDIHLNLPQKPWLCNRQPITGQRPLGCMNQETWWSLNGLIHSTWKNGDIIVAVHWNWTENSVWEQR